MSNTIVDALALEVAAILREFESYRIHRALLDVADRIASGAYGDVRRGTLHTIDCSLPFESSGWKVTNDAGTRYVVRDGRIRKRTQRIPVKKSTPVAIKQLRLSGVTATTIRRFGREMDVWTKLEHPNVLRFLGFLMNAEDGIAWLVSPWAPHGNILEYLSKSEANADERLRLIVETAEGLAYLHAHNPLVCHGDIKSANVVIGDKRQVLLCDFGLSVIEDSARVLTHSTGLKGSIRWMSPELLDGGRCSTRSDMWAWGCLTVEIITGRIPFHDILAEVAVLGRIVSGSMPTPEEIPGLEDWGFLWEIILSCWSTEPERRPDIFKCLQQLKARTGTRRSEESESETIINDQSDHDTDPSQELWTHVPESSANCDSPNVRHDFGNVVAKRSAPTTSPLAPFLASARESLRVVASVVDTIQINRETCIGLLRESVAAIETIRDNATAAQESNLRKVIEQTMCTLERIVVDIKNWAGYGIWTGWGIEEDINRKIRRHHESLAYCISLLGVSVTLPTHGEVLKILRTPPAVHQAISETAEKKDELYAVAKGLQEILITRPSGSDPPRGGPRVFPSHSTPDFAGSAFTQAELAGECVKAGNKPYVTGTRYDVWRGLWRGKIVVCMKSLRNYDVKTRSQERFERQINIWRTLDHRNVLRLHGWCEMDEQTWIISPWLANGNVMSYLTANLSRCSDEDKIRLVRDMLLGLQYLHRHRIVHGSLKPSNVLIADERHAVVTDFAMSKLCNVAMPLNTQSDDPIDDLRYQAPEIRANQPMTPAGDVYSWAMTALEVLSGLRPLGQFKSSSQLLKAIVVDKAVPERLYHECPPFERYPRLWSILAFCWNEDPQKRPTVDNLLYYVNGSLAMAD